MTEILPQMTHRTQRNIMIKKWKEIEKRILLNATGCLKTSQKYKQGPKQIPNDESTCYLTKGTIRNVIKQ